MRTVMKHAMDKATELANVFERYGVQEYMTAVGLCVDPVFRGQGLGLEILKARFDLCKAVDLKVTMTVFTGIASQLLAHRVGMEVIAEVVYEDCKEDGKPAFPNIKCKSAKVMAKRVE
jgi:GNAT superfamily N-acetyltransferase